MFIIYDFYFFLKTPFGLLFLSTIFKNQPVRTEIENVVTVNHSEGKVSG
jgi:hypothetical protein